VMGPVCYDDIKIVNGVKYDSFKEVCFAFGLLDDNKEFINAINQASFWGTASSMCRLFVELIVTNQYPRPKVVFDKVWENLSDDMLYRQRRVLRAPDINNSFWLFFN